jgi:hypothetical protein
MEGTVETLGIYVTCAIHVSLERYKMPACCVTAETAAKVVM